jgi:hypothetical protein
MGDVVPFRGKRKPQRYTVFVVTMMTWEGYNGEDAACKAAQALALVQQPVADFYEPACMGWGEATENPA